MKRCIQLTLEKDEDPWPRVQNRRNAHNASMLLMLMPIPGLHSYPEDWEETENIPG
jgi:hypothetical protein